MSQCDIFWISAFQNESKGSFSLDPREVNILHLSLTDRRQSRPRSSSPPPIPRRSDLPIRSPALASPGHRREPAGCCRRVGSRDASGPPREAAVAPGRRQTGPPPWEGHAAAGRGATRGDFGAASGLRCGEHLRGGVRGRAASRHGCQPLSPSIRMTRYSPAASDHVRLPRSGLAVDLWQLPPVSSGDPSPP